MGYQRSAAVYVPDPGITAPAALVGHGRRPQPLRWSKRFRCCPLAINRLSMCTFGKVRKRNRSNPCQAFASPNNGSTYTFRFRIAFL